MLFSLNKIRRKSLNWQEERRKRAKNLHNKEKKLNFAIQLKAQRSPQLAEQGKLTGVLV